MNSIVKREDMRDTQDALLTAICKFYCKAVMLEEVSKIPHVLYLLFHILFFFNYVYMFWGSVCMHACRCPQIPEKRVRSPWAGVVGSCLSPDVSAGLVPRSSWYVLLNNQAVSLFQVTFLALNKLFNRWIYYEWFIKQALTFDLHICTCAIF